VLCRKVSNKNLAKIKIRNYPDSNIKLVINRDITSIKKTFDLFKKVQSTSTSKALETISIVESVH
jgi:hypothetical protein